MILFQLKCAENHQFEAWFRDGATFEAQSGSGTIECPHCGDRHVVKAPMAPRVVKQTSKAEAAERRAREVARQILDAVNALRDHVEQTCEYVGDRFADEARRIHDGEAEGRGIYGEATKDEAEELDDEGIEYARIPWFQRRPN